MKKYIVLVLIIFSFSLIAQASILITTKKTKTKISTTKTKMKINSSLNTLRNGLVGYWTFNGPNISGTTAFDIANNNNGTLTNGPTRVPGRLGQALNFDGVNDYVNAGAGSSLNDLTVKTIALWVKRLNTSVDSALMSKGTTGANGGWVIQIRVNGGTNGPNNVRYLHTWSTAPGSTGLWYGSTNITNTSAFYHVVVIYDSSSSANNPKIYVNGVSDTVTTAQTPSGTEGVDAANSLYIGIGGDGTSNPHNGIVDDVRIYNRVLSPDEIKRLYNMGK